MFDRWQRNGLAAIPEDMEALQSQMRGADMNIAMLLTWNYMATKFNEQLDAIEKAKDKSYYDNDQGRWRINNDTAR